MMEKWVIKNKKADFLKIAKQFEVHEVLARLLVNRGMEDEEAISKFLVPERTEMHSPYGMKDINKACDLLLDRIQSGKKIRVVGDYDVDGVVATFVLYTGLKRCGAWVDYEIPNRIKDGYGINVGMIEKAYQEEVDTIITCDNGIAAIEPMRRGKELGMHLIITDHHDIAYQEDRGVREHVLPDADAIINPKQEDCNYSFPNICGATVAFKLIQILYERYRVPQKEEDMLLEVVAIATVCDVMDLVDENRVIVKHGLDLLKNTYNIGLQTLMEEININQSKLSTYHLGFMIGPCLNASGRLDTAKKGLALLLSETKEEAVGLARELKDLNELRKEMTTKGLEQAIFQIEESERKEDKILVVLLEDCHESLAGIIAGRLKEKYYKPAIVLTRSEENLKGSGRSIEAYNMFEELTKAKEYLLKFGGHPMAAGLTIREDFVDSFRLTLNLNTTLSEEDMTPKISIDVVLPLGYINEVLIDELELLEPFGKGNPKPIFAERELRVKRVFLLGKNRNVLKLEVVNSYGKQMDALYFGDVKGFLDALTDTYGKGEVDKMFQNRENNIRISAIYYPTINEYGGNRSLQITIQYYQFVS